MSNYYFTVIVLENCPFSNNALELLKKYKNIKTNITTITSQNKENYKTDKIATFPQIYIKKKNNSGSLLLGGYSDLQNVFDVFRGTNYSKDNIKNFITNNDRWSKKAVLRLIELVNC
jgi:glutaredoxin-related protein